MPIWYKFVEFWGWKQAKPPKKIIIIILKLSLELVFNNIVSLSFRVFSVKAWHRWWPGRTNQLEYGLSLWRMDGRKEGRKKERRVSLSYTTETSSETDPTVHSLIFGSAGVVVVGREGGGLSLVQSSKKRATKYGEIGNDRGWIFSLWVHLKLLCKHYGHISASREKEKKKKTWWQNWQMHQRENH